MASLYDIPLTTLADTPTTLAPFRGKVLLIVNVASKCGLTPQYTALEALYQQFQSRGLVVLGFPANNFAGQEPGTNHEISTFCTINYPVTFPMFGKISVVGADQHPLYQQLTTAQPTRISTSDDFRNNLASYASTHGFPPPNELPDLLWNFEKFLVGRSGAVLARFAPDMLPNDPLIIAAIEQALAT